MEAYDNYVVNNKIVKCEGLFKSQKYTVPFLRKIIKYVQGECYFFNKMLFFKLKLEVKYSNWGPFIYMKVNVTGSI